ncbi:MAG: sigma-70 family RNA polymerase sigma factor [Nibricoccus sp.]
MNNILPMAAEETADAELVARTMAGDRDAFGLIVARHQTLICSVAYNATGSLAHSEDVAQETFLAAWRELRELREPAKLRAWLCGIARNIVHNRFRRLKREPVHGAVDLDAAADVPAVEPLPSEQAVKQEREAILWSALERIPELYREPLILFYRQHKSVERVAADLGLSEDVVKQRLSRGRKLLHEQVLAFVEGTLADTTPGVMFTTTVLGSLPLLASAGAASVAGASGGLATKSGAAILGGKLLAAFNIVLGPVIGIFASVVSIRASLKAARTPREQAYMRRYFKRIIVALVLSTVLSTTVALSAKAWPKAMNVNAVVAMSVGSSILLAIVVSILAFRAKRELTVMRTEEMRLHPELFPANATEACGPFKEYRSRRTLLGLPLVHIRLGTPMNEKTRPAIGWIAIGDSAVGMIAIGGMTLGVVSVGGISAGLLAIGGAALGGLAFGGLTLGVLAIGGVAIGYVAEGFTAFGWHAAQGWYAAAREYALGKHASALQANNDVARAWFGAHGWFDLRGVSGRAFLALCWLPAILLLVQYRRIWRPNHRK